MTNGVSAVLAVIQKDVLGLKKAVDMTSAGFNRMKVAAVGFAGIAIGAGMLTALWHLNKAGEKYTHQLEMMKVAGLSLAEQQESIFAANRVASQVMTTTPSENLHSILDLRAALNSGTKGGTPAAATKEATEYLALVSKARAVMIAKLGTDRGNDVYDMVKGLEDIKATQDPKRFEKLLGGMVQASLGMSGGLNSRQWFQTIKYTRGAGQFYSDEFITDYLPTLMQELSVGKGGGQGGGAGNPLASLYQYFVKRAGKHQSATLAHYHMLGADGRLKGSEVGIPNPYIWARDILLPTLKSLGIREGSVQEAKALGEIFGNRVAQQMANLLTQVRKMEGDKKIIHQAMNLDAAYTELLRHDPDLTRKAIAKQFGRVQEDLGKHITPVVNEAIFQMARGLAYLGEVIERHPVRTKWILAFIAALGGFFAIAGTIAVAIAAFLALGSAAFIGLTAAALVLFGTALWYILRLVDWGALGAWVRGLGHNMLALWTMSRQWVTRIAASLKQDILALWTGVTEALISFKNKLMDWVHQLVSMLLSIFAAAGDTSRFGATPLLQPQAYHPPLPNNNRTVAQQVHYVHVTNGRDIADGTARYMADRIARPPATATQFDRGMSPSFLPLRA